MAKFASVLALLISGASAFVAQNGAAKPASALRATEGVWDPLVGKSSKEEQSVTLSALCSEKDTFPQW